MQNKISLENMTLQQLLDEGLHCYHDRKLEQALIFFEKLLEMVSSNTELLHTIVKLLQEMGDFSKAAIYGEKLLELSPEDDDFLLSQAENYFLLKDYQKALNFYLKLYNKHPSSLHLLNRFILIYNDEVECLNNIKNKLVTEIVFDKKTLIDAALSLAETLLDQNKIDESKIILESLLSIDQENLDVCGLYGLYLEKVNNYDKAFFYLEKAVYGARFQYLTILTKCLDKIFNISAVVYYLENLVEKFPNDDLNKKVLGFYYFKKEDYISADRILSGFPVLSDDDIYLFKYKILSRFKMLDEKSGDLDKNELISLMNDFFTLWKRIPQDTQVSSNLMMLYLDFGEIEKAFDMCLKLDSIIPGNLTNKWNKHLYFGPKRYKRDFFDSYLAGRHVRYRKSWDTIKDKVWNGENIEDKRVIVFREQGVGDELLFASNYGWLVEHAAHVEIFCASRLKGVFSDAFPAIQFHSISEQTFDCSDENVHAHITKADKIILAGDLPSFLYFETGSCLHDQTYLKISEDKKKYWNEKLTNLAGDNAPKIGLIWRSGFINGARSSHYLSGSEVAEIISAFPDVEFFNCMYVECSDELKVIENNAGKKIHSLDDLDQKNDFENTAAMLNSLDVLIGAYTATLSLAAAVGTPIVSFEADFLKEDKKIIKDGFYYSNISHISLPLNDSDKRKEAINIIIREVNNLLLHKI